jgi:protocatechuate 3,4-dioxygenase beta subunit
MMALLFVTLSLSLALAQAADPQSAAQGRRGTCEIRGRVTDQASGLPIARALVRLYTNSGGDEMAVRTDEEGRYAVTGLIPGDYDGSVEAGEFRGTHIAAMLSSAGGSTRARRIVLKEGDVLQDVDVALRRALALTVRVVNEWGEPLAAVVVTAHGENGNDFSRSMTRTTDDRGRVRLFGIQPGRYFVCAAASDISPGAATSARPDRFLRTCYPSAGSEADAELVSLERSDIENLEIRMRRGRTFSVSGTVLDASGAAASSAHVMFSQFDRNTSSSSQVSVDADGHFSLTNIPPGEYAIEASLGGPEQPEQRRDLERGVQPIRVDTSDIEGLAVTMAKAVDVAGRIVFEDAGQPSNPTTEHGRKMIVARPAGDQLPFGQGLVMANADEDHSFGITGLFGLRILEVVNMTDGWYVKSIRYRGEEIVGVPTDFKAGSDPSELEVVMSTRGAAVAGRVLDDRGEPVRDAEVFALPADPSQWSPFQLAGASSSESGEFRVGPLRGGDYFIVSRSSSVRLRDPDDRSMLKQLMEGAERITLGNEEQRTVDLRVVKNR